MKKILLATTALAMVSGVSGAMAQESAMMSAAGNEINIGGYYEFGWASLDDDRPTDDEERTYGESELFIDFQTTADNGLTYGVQIDMEIVDGAQHRESENDARASNSEEAAIFIRGGFGTLWLGHDDGAYDRFHTWAPTHATTTAQDDNILSAGRFLGVGNLRMIQNADGTFVADYNDTAITSDADQAERARNIRALSGERLAHSTGGQGPSYNDDAKITYVSPNINGFQFGVSWEDNDEDDANPVSLGASYGIDLGASSIKVTGAYHDNDGQTAATEQEHVQYGVTVNVGAFTATASYYEGQVGQNEEVETYEIGVGYVVSDRLSVGMAYADSENDWYAQEGEYVSVSGSYSIAPGLTTTLAYNNYDLETTLPSGNIVDGDDDTAFINESNEGDELVWQLRFDF